MTPPETWTIRVLADGFPAAGVPVTLLDSHGDPAGHWTSDAAGQVVIPRQAGEQVRIRLGLRNEPPMTLDTQELDRGVFDVTASRSALPAVTEREAAPRPRERTERAESPGHVLTFTRVLVAPPETGDQAAEGAVNGPVDLLEGPEPSSEAPRYGLVLEMEQFWEAAGHATGDLLYTAHVMPGEEMRVAVTDRRWTSGPAERPIEAVAGLVADAGPLDGIRTDGVRSIEPIALVPTPSGAVHIGPAVMETAAALAERATRAGHLLRRRPLAVRVVSPTTEQPDAVMRVLRNPHADRPLAYHFYEALSRYRVFTRLAHVRPVVLVPFRLPALATRGAVRQYAPLLRRVLLEDALHPDLERLVDEAPRAHMGDAPPVSELRLIAHRAPGEHGHDLRRLWCFLHVDQTRYTVHFFPADTPPGVDAPIRAGGAYWIGAIRLSDFHEHPLQFPGRLSFHNASPEIVSFNVLHLEGRAGDRWIRLKTLQDVVIPAQSQLQLASLAALAYAPGVEPGESRLLSHIAANLPYYAAAIVAGGDRGLRFSALARVRDPEGRPVASVIENTVVGVIGTWAAFPLRRPDLAPPVLRAALATFQSRPHRTSEEAVAAIPLPGIWLAAEAGPTWASLPGPRDARDEAPAEEGAPLRGRRWR